MSPAAILQDHHTFPTIRRLTYLEGSFFALMVATTESYALFYFTKNGLSPQHLASLATVPILFGAFAQMGLTYAARKIPLGISMLLAIVVQLIGISGILYSVLHPQSFNFLLLALIFYWVGGQTSAPAWMDWVSKLVKEDQFPHYIGRRNTIVTTIVLCGYVSASFLLKSKTSFIILFSVGFGARAISLMIQSYLVLKFHSAWQEISQHTSSEHSGQWKIGPAQKDHLEQNKEEESIWLRLMPRNRKAFYFKFFLICGLFRLACNISSPFFMPFMINELKLDTVAYVLLTAAPYIGRGLFLQNWSRVSRGIRPFWGIQICSYFIAVLPLLWVVSNQFFWLVVWQLVSGVFWGGMEMTMLLSVQNLYYGRSRLILSMQNAVLVVFTVLGSWVGAEMFSASKSYEQLFLTSGILRFIFAISMTILFMKTGMLSLRVWSGRVYLSSVLSLRPSLSNVGRIILAPRFMQKVARPSLKPVPKKLSKRRESKKDSTKSYQDLAN